MAECKIPVRIDGYKCVEDMAQAVLDYTYKEKTLKEWADSLTHPKTNADRIRAMTDEELADYYSELSCWPNAGREDCRGVANCMECWLDWLKQEASE